MEDPSSLQNLLGESQTNVLPESFITMLTVSFIVLNILGILFLIFYVFGMVRKWRVQTAVLEMRKDLAEIKAQLSAPAPKTEPIPEPTNNNAVIARSDDETNPPNSKNAVH